MKRAVAFIKAPEMRSSRSRANVRKAKWFLLAWSLVFLPSPLRAQAPAQAWPVALHRAMQRAIAVEWRLHKAAGNHCPAMASAFGLMLDSLDSYDEDDHAMVAEALDLGARIQVAAVAPDSPGAKAGIMPGDNIVSVNGHDIVQASEAKTRALKAMAQLADSPPGQELTVVLERNGERRTVHLAPEQHCASRIFVDADNKRDAYTDGANIMITAGLVDFTQTQDELAILAGHELGHVIARDGDASSIGERRRQEDRADLLGADLAMCAGYDAHEAAPFWRRFEKLNILRFISIRLQSSGQDRVRNVAARPFPRSCPLPEIPPLRE